MILERSEKAKKLREQRKFGKKVSACFSTFTVCVSWSGAAIVHISWGAAAGLRADILFWVLRMWFITFFYMKNSNRFSILCQVQIQVMQKRQKEKKAMMNAVKKYQKGDYFT